jgi:hypothetical protein
VNLIVILCHIQLELNYKMKDARVKLVFNGINNINNVYVQNIVKLKVQYVYVIRTIFKILIIIINV